MSSPRLSTPPTTTTTTTSSPSSSLSSSSSSIARNRLASLSSQIMGSSSPSVFSTAVVPAAPEDPLFSLAQAFRQDPSDKKVDLVIGAYRDNNAKPWILPVVKKADEAIRKDPDLNHEYLPIKGLPDFTSAAQKLIVGADSAAIREKRVCTLQAISGTGALHLGALFLAKFHPVPPKVYLSSPTWANHHQIFTNVGLKLANYPYFSAKTKSLDFDGMLGALREAPPGSIIVLHACAHNPTGVDLTQDQWKQVAVVLRERQHFPFFDTAYQGFASGDLSRDSWAIRYFVDEGFELCIAQSFAKNFGLYAANAHIASQLAILQRSEISNPPAYGARIASRILNDPQLFAEWEEDLRTMSGRIAEMRKGLRERLEAKGTPGNWEHITSQIGMFSFTGLTEEQVKILREKWHVYMTKNGRISMAGLNTHNIDYFAEAVDSVVRETS
ncbi:aspartate aminotransferase [Aspergillus novofumigatus IBT 16806]|uniref:aspartate transaminase n=1 Tax=Aspergillus novofumigatus (strain IBT 16806) TaxID=1392255 RepID=A0A2I1CME4_ASPN1|nr:putative aspartate transaminase [Aspergillus novofumigatus IBT 16806]PKX98784.1 putative aspartate transaminase [Aspergillus novofumigatus IBT 16806]